ncbi:MAG: 4-(cytidine 5-diphospho)-2-C-methyl-D-erythritol kinase [Actinomycetota bacterium]
MIYASAPGKLNLFFEVGPLRSDGYHSVISVYQALSIRQTVGVEKSSHWEVITEGDLPQEQLVRVPKDESNLCVIAAKALAEFCELGTAQPMRFKTHKQVPVAAGLAGGSADAAAALIALNEAWCLGLEIQQLMEVGSRVGSDVPFALLGGTALGLDTGIELEKLKALPTKQVVLLVSPIGLSTKEVFGKFDELFPNGDITVSSAEAVAGVIDGTRLGKNSLLSPALSIRPELKGYQSLLEGGNGHLSGSGPTIYFISDNREKAEKWRATLAEMGHFAIHTTTSDLGARAE